MKAAKSERTKVFISYSHEDAEWLNRLRIHLKPLARDCGLDIWDDTRIEPGSRWQEDIKKALESAKVAVLLVSADFLASDFIANDELPHLLSAAEKEGAIILPLILSPSRFLRTKGLRDFQSVNPVSTPLDSMSESKQEETLVGLSVAIENAFASTSADKSQQEIRREIVEDQGSEGSEQEFSSKQENNRITTRRKRSVPLKFDYKRWLPLVIILVAFIVYQVIKNNPAPPDLKDSIKYLVRVTNADTKQPIQGAKVGTDLGGAQTYFTDSEGSFYLDLKLPVKTIPVRVEANGYELLDGNLSVSNGGIEDIRLKPLTQLANAKTVEEHIKQAEALYGELIYRLAIEECDKVLKVEEGNKRAIELKKNIERTLEILRRNK